MNIEQKISFVLDGNWRGQGVIKVIYGHSVEVELSCDCKEFPKGAMIIVSKREIVSLD
jgi:hypothetical protein